MVNKKNAICIGFIMFFSILFYPIITSAYAYRIWDPTLTSGEVSGEVIVEKRGEPAYDYIIGKDYLPHFRVFFWVPKNSNKYAPYADKGVKTDVSEHGAVGKWGVVETNKTNGDEKLVFIYVPKTFVLLHGKGFEKVIHLNYESNKQ